MGGPNCQDAVMTAGTEVFELDATVARCCNDEHPFGTRIVERSFFHGALVRAADADIYDPRTVIDRVDNSLG